MESKKIMWLLMTVFGTLGSYVPALWGDTYFSFASIVFSSLGAILGIWVAFKITR